jgi:hypothetical protein
VALAGGAWAQPASVGEVPTAVLDALKDRVVVVRLRDGAEARGTLLSSDAEQLVLARAPSGEVVALPRRDVAGLRLVAAPGPAAPPAEAADEAPAEAKPRFVGLQLGFAPSVMLDLDHGLLYAFANVSLLSLIVTQYAYFNGPGAASQVFVAAAGAGVSFLPFGGRSPWHLDLFGLVGLDNWRGSGAPGFNLSLGLGVGVHCTLPSGFTVGFKLPVIGAGFALEVSPVYGGSYGPSPSALLGHFFQAALFGFPVVSLGARF